MNVGGVRVKRLYPPKIAAPKPWGSRIDRVSAWCQHLSVLLAISLLGYSVCVGPSMLTVASFVLTLTSVVRATDVVFLTASGSNSDHGAANLTLGKEDP